MYWNFDLNKWTLHYLPSLLRMPVIYAFIKCLLAGLSSVFERFLLLRHNLSQRLNYNGSTISLERFLNDRFGLSEGIYIDDYVNDNVYLHIKDETPEDVYVGYQEEGDNLILSDKNPDIVSGGFVVKIPATMNTPENIAVITKWINYFRLAGTVYKIEVYG